MLWKTASATNYTADYAYLHDETATLELEQIVNAEFKAYSKTLRLGYAVGNTWIKVNITPNKEGDTSMRSSPPYVLRVGPQYLDSIVFYQWSHDHWAVSLSGDRVSNRQNHCDDDLFCFDLSEIEGQPRAVYLKINTDGLRWIETQLMDQKQLNTQVTERVARISVAVSLAMALLLMSLLFVLLEPSQLMRTYCLFQLSACLFTITSTGLLGKNFPDLDPSLVNSLGQFFQVLRIHMTVLLGWSVLKGYDINPVYQWLVKVMFGICAASMMMISMGYAHYALMASFMVFVVNPGIQLMGVFGAKNVDAKLKRILILGYAVYTGIVGFGTTVAFAIFSDYTKEASYASVADWRLNGMFVGIFVFWVVLKQLQNNKLIQLEELQALRMVSLQTQYNDQQLKERRALIDLLTHELKNPMGTIRFALESIKRASAPKQEIEMPVQHIHQSVERMDGLIEHVAQSNQVDAENILSFETIDLPDMIDEYISEFADSKVFEFTKTDGMFIVSNRQMLGIVVENLLTNAYKYASDRRAFVHLTKESSDPSLKDDAGDVLVLTVINQVDPENLPDESKLFERYYRHQNVMGISGLGIGLSLVQSAVGRIGGAVGCHIQNLEVCFTVRLPDNMRKTI